MMSDQPIEVAKKAYSPHNKYLKRELGFTIEEAIQSTDHIEEIAAKCRRWLIGRDEISLKEIPAEGHTLDSMIDEFDEKGETLFCGRLLIQPWLSEAESQSTF